MTKEIDHKSGFKVPEGYFCDFKNRIPDLIKDEKSIKPHEKKSIKLFYFAAASIILLMLSTFVFIPTNSKQKHIEIQLSDIEYYDINMNDIYYAYNDENIEFLDDELNIEDTETINFLVDELSVEELILLNEGE